MSYKKTKSEDLVFLKRVHKFNTHLNYLPMGSNPYMFLIKYFSCEKYEIILTDYEIRLLNICEASISYA